ncbi:hypothetical protein P171DRAFT_369118 [Karstenula rhodostoma CBS 690.94]|uniref:Uncharacterized protein n=1 Tax=Karstenula rhodostoma CBS 690.94 TaxID=1392251 RepID=A0A9P4P7N5_9PLEO|nr:hypothetical protein P171DRAFT_369118 [Karstenula rhodostoma CBS 690.94]
MGSFFNIDPWFFASYVHQAWRKTSSQSPNNCSLPSRDKKQNFLSLQYHRIVTFDQKDTEMKSLTLNRNQPRKAVILPTMRGERIGLIQHGCSVLKVDGPGDEWTGIVLLDAPISHNYTASKNHGFSPTYLASNPFFGGCEDFATSPAASIHGLTYNPATVSNRGMLDELVHYWTQETPQIFTASKPTLRAISYYPLKIVAAEWVNYIAVMGMSVREYELSTTFSGDLIAQLEKLNTNLRILQGWRRRVLSTQAKLRRTIRFIENHVDHKHPSEDWDVLVEDFEFIRTGVAEHGERLEAMVSVVTSTAALIEGRRSLTEKENVTRLTILAVVFLPLSYIESLFSMLDDFRPGGPHFWVYFAIAVPMAFMVGLIAKPPVSTVKNMVGRIGEKIAALVRDY